MNTHRFLIRIAVAALLIASSSAFALRGGDGNQPATWSLIAWNDLGMHCLDSDYSVFSVLPPYNTVNAQLVDSNGDLVTSDAGITVTYEAVTDPTGSMNRSSAGKTNFWSFADKLYGGSTTPDTGLAGFNMPGPGNVPQPMAFDPIEKVFHAEGIPLTAYDDAGHKRTYPLMRIVARDAANQILATATPVLPVSDEVDCSQCHASDSDPAARPATGWVYDAARGRDYRLNILRLHDERHLGDNTYQNALLQMGYDATGLFDTVVNSGTPILCAGCHGTNALPGTGIAGIPPFTAAVHGFHAYVTDPSSGLLLDDSTNRSACYSCHPGSETGCLRGAMGKAVGADALLAMQCQSCHGNMSEVGDPTREGWLHEPTCQNCHTGTATHNNGLIRYTDAFDTNGALRVAVDGTFATEADVPAAGLSLYRFSSGHGGLRCEACHGSTHAIYPASHPNDNLLSQAQQGHAGTLVECSSCHGGNPNTVTGGPHGMHPLGTDWVSDHGDEVQNHGATQCQACHGADYRGTVLSNMHADRMLPAKDQPKLFWRGFRVGCYACHQGPSSDDQTLNHRPVAADAAITVGGSPVALPLVATDADGDSLALRIVNQPANGRVGLIGTTATYVPNPGFAGTDTFTFAAWDGDTDGNLATVTVTRLASWNNYGTGYPGTAGVVPSLTSDADPALGATIHVLAGNTSGLGGSFVLVASPEQAQFDTRWGGALLVELSDVYIQGMSPSGASLAWTVPNDTVLVGYVLHGQSVQFDPGARFHFAFSPGLRLVIGL